MLRGRTGPCMTDASERSALYRFEIVATVLLAISTVAVAWSGFQATRWGQETTKAQAASTASRIAATSASELANTETEVDVSTFSNWANAFARNETVLADFYFARFREEFRPAIEAWIATTPLQNPDAPLTPFVMPEYVLEARLEAERQDTISEAKALEVRRNLQRQSNYVLTVVLFTTALF